MQHMHHPGPAVNTDRWATFTTKMLQERHLSSVTFPHPLAALILRFPLSCDLRVVFFLKWQA